MKNRRGVVRSALLPSGGPRVPFAARRSWPTTVETIMSSWQEVLVRPSQEACPPGGKPLPPHAHAPNCPGQFSDQERFSSKFGGSVHNGSVFRRTQLRWRDIISIMWQLTAGVVDFAGASGVEAVQAEELRHGDPRLAVGVARPKVVNEAAQRRAAQSARGGMHGRW